MSTYYPAQTSKLTLDSGDYIYEALNPNVTIASDYNYVTITAECRNLTTKLKENMEHHSIGRPPLCATCRVTWPCETSLLETEDKKKKEKKIKSREDRFPRDGGRPIKASVPGYSTIPWTKTTLTLIAQSPDGQIHYAKTMDEKKEFAWSNFNWVLVCWPGRYSQDIFLIDDMKEFRKALGYQLRDESIRTDEEGNEWIYSLLFGKTEPKYTSNSPIYTSNTSNTYNPYKII